MKEILDLVQEYVKQKQAAKTWVAGRDFVNYAGADMRYSIDDSKLKRLGWQPQAKFDKELEKIVKYYKKNFIW